MTKSADPDQLASSEANWSGSTLFANTGHDVISKSDIFNSSRILPWKYVLIFVSIWWEIFLLLKKNVFVCAWVAFTELQMDVNSY